MGSTMMTLANVQMPSIDRIMSIANEKIEKKATEEHGFATTKHETWHLLQWMQKDPKHHHGMQSSPHHGCNRRGGSPWGSNSWP